MLMFACFAMPGYSAADTAASAADIIFALRHIAIRYFH